jgi:hypothetical protein
MQSHTTGSPLVSFLYLLMRDHVPPGVVEGIVAKDEPREDPELVFVLTNGHLAAYAEEIAGRLTRKRITGRVVGLGDVEGIVEELDPSLDEAFVVLKVDVETARGLDLYCRVSMQIDPVPDNEG